MTVPDLRLAGGILAVLVLVASNSLIAGEPRFADLWAPVRSVLEIRQERVMIQKWDLSCGAAALGTLLRYQFGEPVTEKQIARSLMSRSEYIGHPELVQLREGFSLLDLKRFVETYHARRVVTKLPKRKTPIRIQLASLSRIASHSARRQVSVSARLVSDYRGEGLGQLDLKT